MPEDYAAAAVRHFSDGSLLENNRSVANADQLFGFAAECAVKFALAELPGFLDGDVLRQEYKKHINDLWDLVPVQSLQRRYPELMALLKIKGPFASWSTTQRYGPDGVVADQDLERHREVARRALGSVRLLGTLRG